MRREWLRFKLRVELDAEHPRMRGDLSDLTKLSVFQCPRKEHPFCLKCTFIRVVKFIPMSMSLPNDQLPVGLIGQTLFHNLARIGAEAHRPTEVFDFLLFAQHRDD